MSALKLRDLTATNYASLRKQTIAFGNLNVFIGSNASGKSTILDVLRFLRDGVRRRDFGQEVRRRGGPIYLLGKWDNPDHSELHLNFEDVDENIQFNWTIGFITENRRFSVVEEITRYNSDGSANQLLSVENGSGWWMSGDEQKVRIDEGPTTCALASALADAEFGARMLGRFISDWIFVDPNLPAIRRGTRGSGSERLDADGINLLERLYQLNEVSPEVFDKICEATRSILGVPDKLVPELHTLEDGHEQYHVHLYEKGLRSPVAHRTASDGTLRILTVMTALYEQPGQGLFAIEEPENNVHPSALSNFVQQLVDASLQKQLVLTTHSSALLDYFVDPRSVSIVQRDESKGTVVTREKDPQGVRDELVKSGFGLGRYYEHMGFGS